MVSELHLDASTSTTPPTPPRTSPASSGRWRRLIRGPTDSMRNDVLPTHARAVIVGGGIIGCSVAYHLARAGWNDVVLLERAQAHLRLDLARRRAGRAAAHHRQHHPAAQTIRSSSTSGSRPRPGWRPAGSGTAACGLPATRDRWTEIRRQATTAHSFGLEMHLLSPAEAKDLWPLMDASDVVGAAFLPTDGQANPSDITQALAKGARMHGVRDRRGLRRHRLSRSSAGGSRACSPTQGEIACEAVALCAGQWSQGARARWPASACRCSRCSTSTSSPSRSTGVTPGPADAARSRPADLLQGGGRRPGDGRLRAQPASPGPTDGVPDGFHFTPARRRLGPFRAADGAGARARAGARDARASSS